MDDFAVLDYIHWHNGYYDNIQISMREQDKIIRSFNGWNIHDELRHLIKSYDEEQ